MKFLQLIRVFAAVCICFSVVVAGTPVLADEEEIVVETAQGAQGFAVGAKAAIVMEAMTGRVLFAQNEHEKLPIASTTKILTSLIALEQPDIDAEFKVNADAIRVEGSSMGLQEGDFVTLRALAAGMLLASGNDGANAAAVRIAGSVSGFAEIMNQRASAIGMENSSFETPSGLDGEKHYSTAYDMALLAREALKNELFASICSQYKMRASYGNPPYDRWLTNHNKLLNYYEGTVGIKTGFTKKAGRCLVTAARQNGVTLICVTLSCPDDWNVHESLYNRYFSEVEVRDIAAEVPEIVIPVAGGTAAEIKAALYEGLSLPVPISGVKLDYKLQLPPFLYAPVKSGQYIGQADILMDGEQVARLTLVADQDIPLLHEYVEKKNIWEWLTEKFG